MSVFVSVKLERQREDTMLRFEEAIRRSPEVVECYLMTGTRDYLLRVAKRITDESFSTTSHAPSPQAAEVTESARSFS